MTTLRLLADDLTGALDSAARFVPLVGPLPVVWHPGSLPPTVAIDADTRDADAASAAATMGRLATSLAGADIAFKKIDSLLRGHVAVELAACMAHFDHCVLAPAFPFQGRITRGGRQLVRNGDGWRDCGVDLPAQLRALGLATPIRDAESDGDLAAIVAAGRALPGRVLWCGTGGLAGALAGASAAPRPVLPRPILALIGSDHPVARAQLAAVATGLHHPEHADPPSVAAIGASLRAGAAAVSMTLRAGTGRSEAAHRIAECFAGLLAALDPPGTLVVAGGATLRGLCEALGADHLVVDGELAPGVPTSILQGGRWHGQRIVSKSGAFGDTGWLANLLTAA